MIETTRSTTVGRRAGLSLNRRQAVKVLGGAPLAPIHHSKAMLIDPKSNEPTRVRRRKDDDGTMERISVKSGESMPRSR